eukprot:357218-Chlamydomonas_euryale.AAC.6
MAFALKSVSAKGIRAAPSSRRSAVAVRAGKSTRPPLADGQPEGFPAPDLRGAARRAPRPCACHPLFDMNTRAIGKIELLCTCRVAATSGALLICSAVPLVNGPARSTMRSSSRRR